MVNIGDAALSRVKQISDYLDIEIRSRSRVSSDHLLYIRTAKIGEEFGEVMQAVIGLTGDNPRKGRTHCREDVQDELCDVILTAMCALHHLTQNRMLTVALIDNRIKFVHDRLIPPGVANAPSQPE